MCIIARCLGCLVLVGVQALEQIDNVAFSRFCLDARDKCIADFNYELAS